MTRILYNISEWFDNLQIHQQVIYGLAIITPMIVGMLSGSFLASMSGLLVYWIAMWGIEKGNNIRREAQEILFHYRHQAVYSIEKSGYKYRLDISKLIGLIMVEKRFDKNSSYGNNIRVKI